MDSLPALSPLLWDEERDSDEDLERLIKSVSLVAPHAILVPSSTGASGPVAEFTTDYVFDAALSSPGLEIAGSGRYCSCSSSYSFAINVPLTPGCGVWEWVVKLENDNASDECSTLGMVPSPPSGSYSSEGGGTYVVRSYNGAFYEDGSGKSSKSECIIHPGNSVRFVYDGSDNSLRFWRRPDDQDSGWVATSNPSPGELDAECWEGEPEGILLCSNVSPGRTYYPGGMSYSGGVDG